MTLSLGLFAQVPRAAALPQARVAPDVDSLPATARPTLSDWPLRPRPHFYLPKAVRVR